MLSPESVVDLSIVGNPNAEDDPGVFEAIKHPTGYRRMREGFAGVRLCIGFS